MTTLQQDPLLTVMYSSTAVATFGEPELSALLAQARAANERNGLTGMLLFRDNRFFQTLEGTPDAVHEVMDRIRADDRHTDVHILNQESIVERRFSDWTMGYVPLPAPREPLLPGVRNSFTDVQGSDDAVAALRAARELNLWFRVRANRTSGRRAARAL